MFLFPQNCDYVTLRGEKEVSRCFSMMLRTLRDGEVILDHVELNPALSQQPFKWEREAGGFELEEKQEQIHLWDTVPVESRTGQDTDTPRVSRRSMQPPTLPLLKTPCTFRCQILAFSTWYVATHCIQQQGMIQPALILHVFRFSNDASIFSLLILRT